MSKYVNTFMEKQELKINIAPDKQQGVFANLALIAHTPTEFVLDFAQLMPGVPQANVVSRVVVTPDQAKKILGALQNNIGQYEQKFGTIEPVVSAPKGSTLPLTFTGGEA
jgi:hypothetical protein